MMDDENNKETQAYSNMGMGIALGVGLGGALGSLPFDGNVGWTTGMINGMLYGLVIGMIADKLGRPPVFVLFGLGLCAAAGLIIGMLLSYSYPALLMWVGSAVGLIAGTVIDTRRGVSVGDKQ